MTLVVVTIFALCWLPYQSYNILQEIYPAINHPRNKQDEVPCYRQTTTHSTRYSMRSYS
ncbi:unnamed protein product [Ixodes persulcatus]|uniref:G-protein coupled receptors family 1 profile domain-containing protein n=1 Tax=Ixodes scapularis TaxID=6945 RepID=B7QDR9_IXOSC|nr:hypothetical protein IscW_ISCW022224 [Ixodes scapularis]|eukprot:XP_002413683.1 hypothetical protein IscW_ISCW022224 [Ixodes scapularis]